MVQTLTHLDSGWCRKGGARGYVTTRPFFWEIGAPGSGWVLAVPRGREFESSVPRPLWWVLSPDDPHFLRAAAVHDVLLESGFPPAFSDSQWIAVALSDGAPAWKAWAAFEAMRARRLALRMKRARR